MEEKPMTEFIDLKPVEEREYSLDYSDEPIMTKQSQQQECDIHWILKNFQKTGELPTNKLPPTYGDFDNAGDYLTAQTQILKAQRDFADLPSEVRDRFENTPAELLAFLEDPANAEEAIALGLAIHTPDEVQPVVPEPAAQPPAEGGDPPPPPS